MSHAEGSTCSTPQRSASGEDSDSDFENENARPRGLTGLQNLGNTCYLNSALQSLSNCPPLTRYFLDFPQLIFIHPEKPPNLSRSYLKLITEIWHRKRPSYVVPSGVVSGIKAVHPMFRGYTQQDAQEFLRCLMDQLHEELKTPYSDDSDDEDEEDDGGGGDDDDGSNNATSGEGLVKHKISQSDPALRRASVDSVSSQSEGEYETCESGLSSERSSNGGQEGGSSDENNDDTNDTAKRKRSESNRKISTGSENTDSVANTKEMKETANLLEKISEAESQSRRPARSRALMEGGDSREQGSSASYVTVPVKESEGLTTVVQTSTAAPIVTQQPKSPVKPASARKAKNTRYDSIISQTFDGKILSSVRCLNCETVSTTKETFQDLSLPIPSKDHLHMLHSGYPAASGVSPPKGGACGEVHQGWLAWMFSWMKSWFIGPTITLQDCLSAFFSADELKGDNMYSCEKCKKLRNGLKYSKVLELPEILSIHLKRFRHEFYSSKISTYISFPLEGLDMEPYLHKACKNEVTTYDLVAIICHHGTAGGGHYTAYCLNHLNEQWYEFDDQYVTEVDISQVQNCEAYVLFYRKSNKKIDAVRQKVMELDQNEMSILRFFISKQWLSRFRTFAEPGPITNKDFLCKHGGVPPGKRNLIDDLVIEIHQSVWELLYSRYGGGPVCNHLYSCKTCHSELEKLRQRQFNEKETFIQLNDELRGEEHAVTVYAISMAWFKEWEAFVLEKTDTPPGPIDNSRIIVYKNGQPTLRQTSDYGQLSRDMWLFLHRIYSGGPELIIRQSTGASVKPMSSSPPPQQTQTSVGVQPVASSSSISSSPSTSGLSQTYSNTSTASTSASSAISSSVPQSSGPSSDGTSQMPSQPQESVAHPPVSNATSVSTASAAQKSSDAIETQNENAQSPSSALNTSCESSTKANGPVLNQEVAMETQESADSEAALKRTEDVSLPLTNPVTSTQNSGTTSLDTSAMNVDTDKNGQVDSKMANGPPSSPVKSPGKAVNSSSAPGQQSQSVTMETNMKAKNTVSAPSSWVSLSQSNKQQISSTSATIQGSSTASMVSQLSNSFAAMELSTVSQPSCGGETGKTSDESLPDSGVGMDLSCSSSDVPATPNSLDKASPSQSIVTKASLPQNSVTKAPSSKEERSAGDNISSNNVNSITVNGGHSTLPASNSSKGQTEETPASVVITASPIESKGITIPAAPHANVGKGKRKNKKGKNMDVTRI